MIDQTSKIQNLLIQAAIKAGASRSAARIATDKILGMLAGNRHFTSGMPKRIYVKTEGMFEVRELAATFHTFLPDADVEGDKRFRVKFAPRMVSWRGTIK